LSSFLQGLSLDPLAVSAPRRHVEFAHESFTEASAELGYRHDRFLSSPGATATLDGMSNLPVPFAYSLTAGYARNGTIAAERSADRNFYFARGWLGFEPGPYDKLVGFVNYEHNDDTDDFLTGLPAGQHRQEGA